MNSNKNVILFSYIVKHSLQKDHKQIVDRKPVNFYKIFMNENENFSNGQNRVRYVKEILPPLITYSNPIPILETEGKK